MASTDTTSTDTRGCLGQKRRRSDSGLSDSGDSSDGKTVEGDMLIEATPRIVARLFALHAEGTPEAVREAQRLLGLLLMAQGWAECRCYIQHEQSMGGGDHNFVCPLHTPRGESIELLLDRAVKLWGPKFCEMSKDFIDANKWKELAGLIASGAISCCFMRPHHTCTEVDKKKFCVLATMCKQDDLCSMCKIREISMRTIIYAYGADINRHFAGDAAIPTEADVATRLREEASTYPRVGRRVLTLIGIGGELGGGCIVVGGDSINIGNDEHGVGVKNDFSISSKYVSTTHCSILRMADGRFALLNHSKFGTIVNGKRLSVGMFVTLAHNDVVALNAPGLVTYVVCIASEAPGQQRENRLLHPHSDIRS